MFNGSIIIETATFLFNNGEFYHSSHLQQTLSKYIYKYLNSQNILKSIKALFAVNGHSDENTAPRENTGSLLERCK